MKKEWGRGERVEEVVERRRGGLKNEGGGIRSSGKN